MIYLDLLLYSGLLAARGVVFFHYWDRIPEGTDLERLVLRKMQKEYRFILKVVLLTFATIIFSGNGWAALPDSTTYNMMKSFALSPAAAVGKRKNESVVLYCFQRMGVILGIFLLVFITLFLDKMHKNYATDKPVTGFLILISVIFLGQLLFWNPEIHNIVCYLYLLVTASYYKEEQKQVESVGIKNCRYYEYTIDTQS